LKTTSTSSTKPVPKWLKMKQQNKSSAGKQTAKPTVQKSSGSAQKPHDETRNSKRARWAKKAKPVAKPVVVRGPVHEYISACCSAPSRKPRAGMKETVKDPESGKMKDKPKGLGHWRCTACGKVAKVTPCKPAPKEIVDAVRAVNAASVRPIEENPYLTPEQKSKLATLPPMTAVAIDGGLIARVEVPVA